VRYAEAFTRCAITVVSQTAKNGAAVSFFEDERRALTTLNCVHGLRTLFSACRAFVCTVRCLREVPRSATSLRAADRTLLRRTCSWLCWPRRPAAACRARRQRRPPTAAPAPVADHGQRLTIVVTAWLHLGCLAGRSSPLMFASISSSPSGHGLGVDAPSEMPDRAAANSPVERTHGTPQKYLAHARRHPRVGSA